MMVFSFDLAGDFALFKKNDANDMVYISYNFIHKPSLLGILGAIIGLTGYAKSGTCKHPEFYNKLKNLKIAIKPNYIKPLKKVIVCFNNASGLASINSANIGQTWQVKEQVLVGEPEIKYTIFILDNDSEEFRKLRGKIKNGETEYPLYFGKNEFFAYYDNYQEYSCDNISENTLNIHSLVRIGEKKDGEKKDIEIKQYSFDDFDPFNPESNDGYTVYEYLPYDFDEKGFYKKDIFILTQRIITVANLETSNIYQLISNNGGEKLNVQFI